MIERDAYKVRCKKSNLESTAKQTNRVYIAVLTGIPFYQESFWAQVSLLLDSSSVIVEGISLGY